MVLKLNDVVMTHAPQIPGQNVNQILEESMRHTNIDSYMPDLKDRKFPSRDFVINVGIDNFMHNVDSEYSHPRSIAENDW